MASSNGKAHHAPLDFPPPVNPRDEFIKREVDPEDEVIEVGVAIVGGGTAGLATANRLLQLLGDDPELMESLGEVPVAVIEKAKTCGGHNLSGAVMRPGPAAGAVPRADAARTGARQGFAYGEVDKEAVYMTPTAKRAIRIPPPPPFKNHGNEVISVSALARYQQEQAEEGGAYVLTETSATQLLVEDGSVQRRPHGRQGPRQGRPAARQLRARHGRRRQGDGAGRGLLGPPHRRRDQGVRARPRTASRRSGSSGSRRSGRSPSRWTALIHTIGPWPLKLSSKYGQIGGTWIYPMKDEKTGDDLVSIGFVVDLEYADATTSAHDLLQPFKMHPLVRKILEGGERVAWGAKALPGGGYWSMPKLTMPGALLVGDSGGMVDTVALKGVHHCIKSGHPRRRGDLQGAQGRLDRLLAVRGRGRGVARSARSSTRSATPASRSRRASSRAARSSNLAIATKGKLPPGKLSWHRNDAREVFVGDTHKRYPKPDGKYTFDKLSSVFITGNATRDDAPNHIRVQKNVPREVAETWKWMCPAGVYEIPDDAPEEGIVDVTVNYTNCVQCGAITAKGGRLTTPEGGDGPLYQVT